MANKYPSTLLAQENTSEEIQKADLDLLKKINEISSGSDGFQEEIDEIQEEIEEIKDDIDNFDTNRLLTYQKDTVTRTFSTTVSTGWTTAPFTVPAGDKIIVDFSLPARNDDTSWGGAYTWVYYRKNGGTWNSLGNTGYDTNVMYNSAASIATYSNNFILDFSGSATDSEIEIQFRIRAYSSTVTINGSHEISNGDATAEYSGLGFAWSHVIATSITGKGAKGNPGSIEGASEIRLEDNTNTGYYIRYNSADKSLDFVFGKE